MKRFGGRIDDYLPLHDFLDSSKEHFADIRHRAVLHNTFGIYLAERVFGSTLTICGTNRHIPTRVIAERHVLEDLGQIPTLADWLRTMPVLPWMRRTTPHMRTNRNGLAARREGDSELM